MLEKTYKDNKWCWKGTKQTILKPDTLQSLVNHILNQKILQLKMHCKSCWT